MTPTLQAQSDVTAIAISNVAAPNETDNVTSPSDASNAVVPSTAYTLNYGSGNDVRVTSYTVGGLTYNNFVAPDTLMLRRVSSSRLVNIWYQDNGVTGSVVTIQPSKVAEADAIYLSDALNTGYDNILVNEDDLAGGSIEVETERVDVIWYSGIQTPDPTEAVFPIIERGGNDNIIVAPILSLDANGDPASYGTTIGIGEDGWPALGQTFAGYIILRRETVGLDPIPLLDIGSQIVQGVAVSFSDMDVAADQTIFGYSIFPADVADEFTTDVGDILTTGEITTLKVGIDLTDISTFPTNTLSSDSGLDLVAGVAAGVASTDNLIIPNKGPGGYKASLATWLKANEAADVTTSTDASTVTDWQDHWIGDNDATTGVAAPTYRSTSSAINFNPTVDFTAASTSLTIANNTDFNTATSYTNKGINLAFRTSTADITDRQVLYEQGGNTRGITVYIRNSNLHVSAWNRNSDGTGSPWNNATNITTVSTSVALDTEYIITLELAGTSGVSGTLTPYLNGASFGSLSSVGLLFADTDGIEFGGSDGSTQYDDGTNSSTNSFEGEISEFIYCNEPTAFLSAQRNRIESYLAIKYGITLDQSTPINYVNSDGTTIFDATNSTALGGFVDYNHDIAGIGRDDASELDQPASKSENSDAIVTVDRGASISTDDAWLIWGNDDGALTESGILTSPDTVDMRLERVWRVSETDEVLTTSVSFDLTTLGLSSNQNDYSLLIAGNSSSGDFSSATVLTGGVLVGSVLTFSGVDLEDGQFFTLGTSYFECAPGGVEEDLTLWLRADEGVTLSGSDVTDWVDQSGTGNDAIGASGARPEISDGTMNYNDAFDFISANGDVLTGNGGFNTTEYWMVILPDNTFTSASTTEQVPLSGDRNIADAVNFTGGGTDLSGVTLGSFTAAFPDEILTHAMGGSTTWRSAFTGGGSIAASDTYIFNVKNNLAANSTNIYQNGVTINNGTAGSLVNSTDIAYAIGAYASRLDLAIGSRDHFDGRVAEIISYSARKTDAQRRQIQSYLAIKYGVTIDQSAVSADDRHYYAGDGGIVWNATDNADYDADIAGIGRDDLSCFEQKQSQSVNSGSIVAMGLNTIETDNAANANSFTADDSFLIWGDDGDFSTQANANTSDVPGIVTERMERIWKVEETGTVGATTVQFDINGLGYSTDVSDFNLITSSTSTMASGSVTPAASLVGGILTFTGVDFTDGDFFTIGTARTNCGPGGITTGLTLWLKADQGTKNGGGSVTSGDIDEWENSIGNGSLAEIATGNSNPLKVEAGVNYNPYIEFNGTDEDLILDNVDADVLFSDQDNTTFYTFNMVTGGAGVVVGGWESDGTGERLAYYEKAGSTLRNDFVGGTNMVGATNIADRFVIATSLSDVSNRTLYINGNQDDQEAAATFTAASNTGDFALGSRPGGSNYTASQGGEMIIFDNDLSQIEIKRVETYLAIKYGITLSNDNNNNAVTNELISGSVREGDYLAADGTSVIWTYADNTTYHNDVAGIGRDDDGCFAQKQSSSINTDDILSVGLGTIDASNAENVNGFNDNGDYLVWGNDNGTTVQASAETSDIPNSLAERIARVWKVQDTGTVGETELQFDLTGLGYSVADAAAFSLLVGNTATMADATIITGGTLNGSILSFTGVNLTDGQFFSVGTAYTTCGPGGVNTNIALWLRADLEVFSDAGVTAAIDGNNALQWDDQSSPSDDASESNLGGAGPIEPTFQTNEINFNPVLDFIDPNSSNASYIESTSNTVSGDMTLISVFKTGQTSGTANDFVNSPALIGASETGGTLDYGFGMENGNLWVNANTTTTFDVESGSTYNDNVVHIGLATRTQSGGAIALFVDGAADGTGTGSTSALTDPTSFGIGNHSDGDVDAQYAGEIAETLVFSQVLSSDERNRVETYLALKYGITLNGADDGGTGGVDERDYRASDGGVIWDFDGQGTTYYNDIFGIGKDDPSCFEQTSAKSENSDALVTFTQPGGSFSTDDSFIISGNDNAAIEATRNPERPATIDSRLNREWRVQETGTVGSIELTYDISTITGTEFGANNLTQTRLLVDDDGDFSNGGTTIIEPTSFDGSAETVTFTVDFTDGQYYTLGSIETGALPITLISFEAAADKDNQVKLDWVSASETNNAFYTIENSTDGVNFNTVANVDGAGNSDAVLFYSYIDKKPVNGLSFYRLKQTDFSGEFTYSELRSVRIERTFKANYSAYPNPVTKGETLRISYIIDRDQTLRLAFLNTRGQVVARDARHVKATDDFIEVSTDRLDRGLNLIRVLDESGNAVTLKVIVR